VVLEEAPAPLQAVPPRRADEPQLLLVSARDDAALGRARERLATALESLPAEQLADAAQTLHRGRQAFARRSAVVAGTPAAAAAALRAPTGALRSQATARDGLPVAFLFAGQGAQRVDTWRGLYAQQPVFREELDACVDALRPHLGRDLRELLFPAPAEAAEAQRLLDQTRWTQPALVSLQLALSRLFQHWGVQPAALLGHSVGEWTAACLAGCFTREDTLALVARRGALMQQQSPGAMLAVRASVADLQAELGDSVALAACNAPRLNVLAGPAAAMDAVAARLEKRGIGHRRLVTSHAFHSPMMDPLLAEFEACVARTPRRAPTVPWVSSLTGSPITSEQAQSPAYWARQLRETVQFSEGVGHLLSGGFAVLDIGPGDGLARLARQHPQAPKSPLIAAAAAPAAGEGGADAGAAALHEDLTSVLRAAGALWCAGAALDAEALRPGPWRRVRLPHYPFADHRHWVDPAPAPPVSSTAATAPSAAVPATVPGAAPGPGAPAPIPTTGAAAASPAPENTTPSTPSLAPMSLSPASHLMPALRALVADLSGVDAASLDAGTPFLALGLDSLALTQLTQAVQKQFGVRLPLRRLLEDLDTLDALAAELAPQVPAAPVAPASPAPSMPVPQPSAPVAAPASAVTEPAPRVMPAVLPPLAPIPVGGPALAGWADVIAQQLQVMQRQLEVMRQGASPVAVSVAPLEAPVAMPPAPAPVPAASHTTAAVPSPRAAAAPPAPGSPAHGPYRPPSTQRQGSLLSAAQAEQLQAFTARYTARTAQSKRMTQDSRGVLADPRSVAGYRQWCKELVYPLVTQRSAGSRLWDVDGNEYIDITNGFGMILFGHNPDTVREAVQAQLERGYEIGPQTPLAASVARDLCAMVGLERAAFCSTGSEAVMAAMRLARTVTGRDTVVVFAGAYHGVFDEVLVRVGADGAAMPIAPGIPASAMQHVKVLEYGTPESLQAIRRLGPELAAVLVEPVQSRRPELQPREFLQELRRITADCGAALVFDEVVTGFRVHPGGAQALFGVKADMATYGKVLGGGLPIGVLAGAARFLDALDGGPWQFGDDSAPEVGVTFFAGTFVRHPLALAAAQAVLGRLQREGPQLQRELNQRTTRLVQELRDTAQTLGVPLQVPHFASWFCLRWPAELPLASLFFAALRLHGLHVWEGRPCFLTTAHSDEDLQRIVQAVRRALIELQQAGLLPAPDGAETPTTTVDTPPVPGARKGRDREGREAWFVPDPDRPGKFLQVLGTGVPPRNEAR
jgi:glutamate-1-semialdehyde aminotransferase/malonyl CoA-acyl carrier protein transacylase/acyl carrier protein